MMMRGNDYGTAKSNGTKKWVMAFCNVKYETNIELEI